MDAGTTSARCASKAGWTLCGVNLESAVDLGAASGRVARASCDGLAIASVSDGSVSYAGAVGLFSSDFGCALFRGGATSADFAGFSFGLGKDGVVCEKAFCDSSSNVRMLKIIGAG